MSWIGMSYGLWRQYTAYGSREMTPRVIHDLNDIEQELFELTQKVSLAAIKERMPTEPANARNA